MHYGKINPLDVANGPGVRVSLFVSGCRNHCKGCFNPETWDFNYGKQFDFDAFYELVRDLKHPNVSGLSILGGDPFEPENRECVELICEVIKALFPDKSIWIWTGYRFEDLAGLPGMKYIDVLVDGRFEIDKKNLMLQYRGSSNQRVIDVKKTLRSGGIIECDVKDGPSRME